METNGLVTVKTFSYINEVGIVRSYLESEGIETFTKDEFVSSTYATPDAFGGIKLQVKETDVDKTIQLLKEGGYLKDKDLEPSSSLINLYKFFSRIPFLKKVYK
jgi:hypothetical protein